MKDDDAIPGRAEPRSAAARRAERSAVRRALRAGQVRDARIDALARRAAEQTVGRTWMIVVYGAVLVSQLLLLISRLSTSSGRHPTAYTVVTMGFWIAAMVAATVAFGQLLVMYRRSRRYLRDRWH